MIRCRDAVPADAAAIRALFGDSFAAAFGHLYRPADLSAFLSGSTLDFWHGALADPDRALRLVEHDGAPVGFAELGGVTLPVEPAGPAAELRRLYLLPAAQGTGTGRALTQWAIAAARARGAGELFLSVFVDNHRARRLYERFGFQDIGGYGFRVGEHVDEDRLMRLAL